MKLLDMLKRVGAGAISAAVPGGPVILGLVNELLPPDKQLPADVSGDQARAVIDTLPPEQRGALLDRQFAVQETEIREAGDTLRVMLTAEQQSTHTTRPYIAKGAFHVVAACSLMIICTWCVGVLRGDVATIAAANEGADLAIYLLGPLVALLWAYFGILKTEQRQRLDAANRLPAGGVAKTLAALLGRR